MERISHNHADDTSELLSAYVDGAVDVTEYRRAEQLTQQCTGCAQEVRELRMFKELLRELPTVQPRRSFTLDPATAPSPRRLLFPTFRWATLAATALLVMVLGIDALGGGTSATTETAQYGTAFERGTEEFQFKSQDDAGMATAASPAAEAAGAAPAPEAAAPAGGAAESGAAAAASPEASGASAGADTAAEAAPEGENSADAAESAPPSATTHATQEDGAAPNQPEAGSAANVPTATVIPTPVVLAGATPAAGESAADQSGGARLSANEPAGVDTTELQPPEPPQTAFRSSWNALLIAEVFLGIVVLAFGAAAFWTWRRRI